MSVKEWTLLGGDSETNSSIELDELPSNCKIKLVLTWELETSSCFEAWNNFSIADSRLTESSYFQAGDS
jgi:hypothetical protein